MSQFVKQKILVVDDDENICDLIRMYFENEGFAVTTANDGLAAIDIFKNSTPDMVVLDIMMPGADGWQVCREIRKISQAPVIMLSAKGEVFDKVLALELGADDYMVKPVRYPELLARAEAIIRRAQQFISEHVREKLTVPLVARHVDVSPSYLTALFHKNLQISPGEYIRRTKLQESKQMIRENNLNFTEIAAELQYSTVHHFSRQFKEKFGITPTEYAKSVR